ncbi:MAG: hypothetical protein WC364_09905 [Eubacteriales bacterium]
MKPNYSGDCIPAAAGLIFFMISPFVAFMYLCFYNNTRDTLVFFVMVASFAFLGFIDDVWGSREVGGLAGHFKVLLFKKELTTGALKALGGFFVSLLAALVFDFSWWVFVYALVIAMSANMINLLDLRPGRAGKGFILIAVFLLILGWKQENLFFLIALLGGLLAYLKTDLKARAMLGDSGSNSLGAVLGITAMWVLDKPVLLIYLLVLAVFHLLSEKYSVTKIISGNRLLDYLDRLGRCDR